MEASAEAVVFQRRLPGPPERVFAAWTDPALLARWMSPFAAASAQVDLRVGGHFSIVMHGPGDGGGIHHSGTYRVVDPPHRLVFTWRSPFTGPEPSVISLTLRPVEDGTELTLVHEHLPADQVASHRGGWNQILDHLANVLLEVTAWM
jgi:uncharacterized protein YndB with AHSA1/START domain